MVDALDYDFQQFSLDHFVTYVETVRSRKIQLLGVVLKPELYALWVPQESIDYVFFNNTLHPTHQTHSILHELAHILLDHAGIPLEQILSPYMLAQLGLSSQVGCPRTGLPISMWREQEVEAEYFVLLIQKKVVNAQRIQQLYKRGSSVELFKPYADGMGFED